MDFSPAWLGMGGRLESSPVVFPWILLGAILTSPSCLPQAHPDSLEGQGEIVLAGLAVAHQVAGLFARPEHVLGICSTDGPVVPAEDKREEGGISAGSLAVLAHPFWVSPAGKPVAGGEGRGESPQLDTDTHTWFSRGNVGSVHSPRGLLGSTFRGLADLGFPAESRGGSRPFSSRPGDRQLFSDPSNWAVGNIPVIDSEDPRDRAL